MYYVYILKSRKVKRFYVGHTNNVIKRLSNHNAGKVRSTKAYRPWEIINLEEYKSKNEAYRRELQIKSFKGGEAFEKLVKKDKIT